MFSTWSENKRVQEHLPELLSSAGPAAKFIQGQPHATFHRKAHAFMQVSFLIKLLLNKNTWDSSLDNTVLNANCLKIPAYFDSQLTKDREEMKGSLTLLFCFWAIFSHFSLFSLHCFSVPVKAKYCNSFSVFKHALVCLQFYSCCPLCHRLKKCIIASWAN